MGYNETDRLPESSHATYLWLRIKSSMVEGLGGPPIRGWHNRPVQGKMCCLSIVQFPANVHSILRQFRFCVRCMHEPEAILCPKIEIWKGGKTCSIQPT